ncbi:MAG: hypothetical protein COU08_02590 [Candidatus Harrisonbacteria bacterium CG10_big_fil_rev_8_21_14_0_10_42_17]|uniref:Uncharacterized protein n=1 Tax=Candidatus Harrisonbacteria bacterium CG10_big_fil_rev_8_21_14_0_10_42_17 TaxID=1974584 RepID=A0A2M6WHT8_9BACT|nr:MAG: hypothetical protein COU08_02590 [Candidatus Harrisonbacteria bacterium CG10_big_fil_rev_8_21_14_0_10_42_17]
MLGLKNFVEKKRALLESGEVIQVIEIADTYIAVVSAKANSEKKKIIILDEKREENNIDNIEETFQKTVALMKEVDCEDGITIAINLDAKLANTIHSSVSVVRPHPNEEINESDLRNVVSEAMWRAYDRERPRAAEKLDANELDIVLADARVKNILLDDHRVSSPLGFKARKVKLELVQTFTTRNIFEKIKELIPFEQERCVEEIGSVMTEILKRTTSEQEYLVAILMNKRTDIFIMKKGKGAYLDSFHWGRTNLIGSIMKNLSLSKSVAERLYHIVLDKEASRGFLTKFEKLITAELQIMINGLVAHAGKAESRLMFVYPFFELPEIVWTDRFKKRFPEKATLRQISTKTAKDELGLEINDKNSNNKRQLFSVIASIAGCIDGTKNEAVARIVKRNVHWLISAKGKKKSLDM